MSLSFQVLAGVAIAIILGYARPATAVAMKPLGDAFIRLITMIITLVIFCTLVTGIAGMDDMKKVGRVGGKALLYFEGGLQSRAARRTSRWKSGAAGQRFQCRSRDAGRAGRGGIRRTS